MHEIQRWAPVVIAGLLLLKAADRFIAATNRASSG
jgi:hypothetical protein